MKKSKFIFITFLIFGCSDGSVVERWTDGTVKTKLFIDGNNECYEYYGEHNNVIEEGCYYGKEKNGKWITYFENGNTKTITHYQHGILGGEYIRFSEEGAMLEKILYIDGFAEDKMKADDNQSLTKAEGGKEIENFIRPYNNLPHIVNFDDDNGFHSIGQKKDGRKVGEWRYFHSNGNLWAKGEYLDQSYSDVEIGDLEDERLKLFPKEKLLKKGIWEIYNNKNKLRYKVHYKLENNKYTSKVKKMKD